MSNTKSLSLTVSAALEGNETTRLYYSYLILARNVLTNIYAPLYLFKIYTFSFDHERFSSHLIEYSKNILPKHTKEK